MKYINFLLSKNIKPIMVFDGCRLPSKKDEEKKRRERRDLNRKKAAAFLLEGKRAEARECLQKSIDITPQMALNLINACRDKGVDCLVAPYEADSQLAYLNRTGIAQIIITEDSDLLLFGCERILFKMDLFGNGTMIERRRLNEVLALKNGFYTFEKFRHMCILSGCDYLPSLSGIGLAKSNKVFKLTQQTDIRMVLKKLPTYINITDTVTTEYMDGFVRADNTFLYQLVFDPRTRQVVPLNPYPKDVTPDDMPYAGTYKPKEIAYQLSLGNVDIYTEKKNANFDPDRLKQTTKQTAHHMLSIWHPSYRPMKDGPLKQTQVKGHVSTQGQQVNVDSRTLVRSFKKKRRSSEVENEPVIQDSDLTDIYTTSSPNKRVKLHESPVTKPTIVHQSNSPSCTSQTSSHHQASPFIPTPVTTKQPSNTSTNPPIQSTNVLLSPTSFNKFAIKSPEVKEKFNLNATKVEVKSRFFAKTSGSSLIHSLCGLDGDTSVTMSTSTSSKDQDSSNNSKISPVRDGGKEDKLSKRNISISPITTDKKITEWDKTDRIKSLMSPITLKKSDKSPKTKTTPTSAFSWSKFSFMKKSVPEESSQDALKSPKEVQMPFKKLTPLRCNTFGRESDCEIIKKPSLSNLDYFCKKPSSSSDCDPSTSDSAYTDSNDITHDTQSSDIGGSTQNSDVTDRSRQTDCTEICDVIDLSQDDEEEDIVMSSSYPKLSTVKKTATSSQPQMTQRKLSAVPASDGAKPRTCRVSGLRNSQQKSAPLRQKSVRDMLAKFTSSSENRVGSIKTSQDDADHSLSPFFANEQFDVV